MGEQGEGREAEREQQVPTYLTSNNSCWNTTTTCNRKLMREDREPVGFIDSLLVLAWSLQYELVSLWATGFSKPGNCLVVYCWWILMDSAFKQCQSLRSCAVLWRKIMQCKPESGPACLDTNPHRHTHTSTKSAGGVNKSLLGSLVVPHIYTTVLIFCIIVASSRQHGCFRRLFLLNSGVIVFVSLSLWYSRKWRELVLACPGLL